MKSEYNLNRFVAAQQGTYETALNEITAGRKRTHWMWYIFPQIAGLGQSEISKRYAIKNLAKAEVYLKHPILGPRLIEISEALLSLKENNPLAIFGSPDYLKLKSSATLFSRLRSTESVFENVLEKFFDGKKDEKTLEILNRHAASAI